MYYHVNVYHIGILNHVHHNSSSVYGSEVSSLNLGLGFHLQTSMLNKMTDDTHFYNLEDHASYSVALFSMANTSFVMCI